MSPRGERLILLSHAHQPAASPYRASGPIFVGESAGAPYDGPEVPPVMRGRLLSLRAYDEAGMIADADIADGREIEGPLRRLFARPDTAYIHLHNAMRGCYSCRVDRG
jgi:hypothetical protein